MTTPVNLTFPKGEFEGRLSAFERAGGNRAAAAEG